MSTNKALEQAREKLSAYGQEHVLQYYDTLSDSQKEALLNQISELDLSVTQYALHRENLPGRGVITPLKAMEISQIKEKEAEYRSKGLELIRQGKLGAVLLAGGMGTRLGSIIRSACMTSARRIPFISCSVWLRT